jgi:hypothetical protein
VTLADPDNALLILFLSKKEIKRNKIKRALSGSAKVTYSRGRGTLALIKVFGRNKIKGA